MQNTYMKSNIYEIYEIKRLKIKRQQNGKDFTFHLTILNFIT